MCGKILQGTDEENSNCCCKDEDSAAVKGQALVEDILTAGGDHPLTPTTPGALLPSYYNHELVLNGQNYFTSNTFNMFVVKLSGLLSLLTSPNILKILKSTNKSSEPVTAYKRYLQTISQMMKWYESDLRNPNSSGRQSIETVRKHHGMASKTFGPITQMDMALTQFGFIGLAITSKEHLGLPEGQVGLIHLWRVIGHMLGVQDRFNLFRGCIMCTRVACQEIAKKVFGPGFDEPPEHFQAMANALLEGMWPLTPLMSPVAFIEHTRLLYGRQPKQLNFIQSFTFHLQISVHKMLQFKIISFFLAPIMNFQIWLTLFFQRSCPILAYIAFGK